ncbi:MAG TPA: cytochrome c [Steroidobacteraceae bacterium]|nr:cytochrome c [Steroidobacteraceae bacterium]
MRWVVATLALSVAACATSAEPVSAQATPASPTAPSNAATPLADAAGQQAYARNCLSCHQSDGYGVPNMQPAITGGTWVQGDAKALALFVMTGGFNSAERKESESHNVMPAFRQLPDAELAAILTYIRQKFGKGAPAVSAADVAAARASLPPG